MLFVCLINIISFSEIKCLENFGLSEKRTILLIYCYILKLYNFFLRYNSKGYLCKRYLELVQLYFFVKIFIIIVKDRINKWNKNKKTIIIKKIVRISC